MLLVIDAGNTNTVFAVYNGEALEGQWRLVTDGQRTADEYAVWLSQVLALNGVDLKEIDDAIISSVVPPTLFNLRQFGRTYLGKEPLIVGTANTNPGIDIRIDAPSTVGADRIVNAVGAFIKYNGNLIVIDFGTATTLDVIGSDGAYEGGIIAPGVNLSIDALHKAAAKLPHIAIERPDSVIGKNTLTAMKSGVYWGYISLIEGLVERIKKEWGSPLTVIATGGLSRLLRHGTSVIDHVDADLTIEGLREIYRRNRDNG